MLSFFLNLWQKYLLFSYWEAQLESILPVKENIVTSPTYRYYD